MKKYFVMMFALCFAGVLSAQEEALDPAMMEMEEVSAVETAVPAVESSIAVELKIGSAVEEREIVGESEVFDSASTNRVYCWTRVSGAQDETQIFHKWYLGEKLISEVPLNIKGSPFRSWSYKTIVPELAGAWKVEVVDSSGVILGFKTFNVQ